MAVCPGPFAGNEAKPANCRTALAGVDPLPLRRGGGLVSEWAMEGCGALLEREVMTRFAG